MQLQVNQVLNLSDNLQSNNYIHIRNVKSNSIIFKINTSILKQKVFNIYGEKLNLPS